MALIPVQHEEYFQSFGEEVKRCLNYAEIITNDLKPYVSIMRSSDTHNTRFRVLDLPSLPGGRVKIRTNQAYPNSIPGFPQEVNVGFDYLASAPKNDVEEIRNIFLSHGLEKVVPKDK